MFVDMRRIHCYLQVSFSKTPEKIRDSFPAKMFPKHFKRIQTHFGFFFSSQIRNPKTQISLLDFLLLHLYSVIQCYFIFVASDHSRPNLWSPKVMAIRDSRVVSTLATCNTQLMFLQKHRLLRHPKWIEFCNYWPTSVLVLIWTHQQQQQHQPRQHQQRQHQPQQHQQQQHQPQHRLCIHHNLHHLSNHHVVLTATSWQPNVRAKPWWSLVSGH